MFWNCGYPQYFQMVANRILVSLVRILTIVASTTQRPPRTLFLKILLFELFVYYALYIINQCHRFHSKLIPNWYASNRMHFHYVLCPNQSQFLVIFKFFVWVASLIANHFHQFHLRDSELKCIKSIAFDSSFVKSITINYHLQLLSLKVFQLQVNFIDLIWNGFRINTSWIQCFLSSRINKRIIFRRK
jgi:hypothetical protein